MEETNEIHSKNSALKGHQYIYSNTGECISILENEFDQLVAEINLLYNSNQEMLEYDCNDYDLMQAREDNLVLINKYISRLTNIQKELVVLCPTNPYSKQDILSLFSFNEQVNSKHTIIHNDDDNFKEENDDILLNMNEIINEIEL